jgi:hypothetical protein
MIRNVDALTTPEETRKFYVKQNPVIFSSVMFPTDEKQHQWNSEKCPSPFGSAVGVGNPPLLTPFCQKAAKRKNDPPSIII